MLIPITKGARKFGYLIWTKRRDKDLVDLLNGLQQVEVIFNGFNLGLKKIDLKYNRISVGYKFTRALPKSIQYFDIELDDAILKVDCR